MATTIFDLFADAARRAPEKPLFERPGLPTIGYGAALETTGRLAAALDALGVAPGDRVAVQVDKSPEAMLLCLACFRRGAVYLPLNPAHTAAEIDYFLTDAEPTLFICRPEALDQHRAAPSQGLAVESLGRHGDGTLLDRASALPPAGNGPPAAPDDLAAILYTSGTTGRSKGAMMTHDNLVSNCRALIDAWRFVAEDRLVHALPIFHTHGLFVAGNMSVATGATMIFLDAFDTDAVLDALRDATVLMGVPTFYTRLLQSDRLTRDAVARVRLFVSGSAPLLAETHAAFTARTGQAILERYGMTETGMITSNPYDGERRPGTVGFPLPGVTIRVTDRETGAALPDGEVGVIEVQGPNVFRGYWRMSDKTAAEFRPDGYFITGDLARIDADGYTHIVGRAKDLVISGGNNVYPKEVEQALDALEGVLESAVIGLPHPDLGEAVTAIVVLRPGAKPAEDGLRAGLTDTLARYKQPRRILFAEALPRNVMGKVQKAALRERHATLYEAPASGARS